MQAMGGMIHAMRRTLTSCISPRHHRACTRNPDHSASHGRASAQDNFDLDRVLASLGGLDRQEVAALAVALAILGFSVVAAILLMRTRTRAAENEVAACTPKSRRCRPRTTAATRCCCASRRWSCPGVPAKTVRRSRARRRSAGRRTAASRAGFRQLARARTVAAARARRRSAAQRCRGLRIKSRDRERPRGSKPWAGWSAARRSCAFAS